ncbi:hypothetical protein ACLOJK_014114 [Asimina triloba]
MVEGFARCGWLRMGDGGSGRSMVIVAVAWENGVWTVDLPLVIARLRSCLQLAAVSVGFGLMVAALDGRNQAPRCPLLLVMLPESEKSCRCPPRRDRPIRPTSRSCHGPNAACVVGRLSSPSWAACIRRCHGGCHRAVVAIRLPSELRERREVLLSAAAHTAAVRAAAVEDGFSDLGFSIFAKRVPCCTKGIGGSESTRPPRQSARNGSSIRLPPATLAATGLYESDGAPSLVL